MEKLTRIFIFNLALLAGVVTFVTTDHNYWAIFFTFLLFVDKL